MTNITHIFFDLDHTLWDFDRNSGLSFKQIFQEQDISLNLEDFLKVYEPINLKYWKMYREEKINKEKLRYSRLKETFDILKYEISDSLINTIAKDYIDYLPNNNHLIEGTLELLGYLKEQYQLHIITNGFEEVQDIKLRKSNIKPYFDVIVTSESVGVKKPNIKVFNFALEQAGVNPENAVMIGDSYEADIMGALNAGMHAIFYSNTSEKLNNEVTNVNSLLEIKQYL